jgi:hypothetical protein
MNPTQIRARTFAAAEIAVLMSTSGGAVLAQNRLVEAYEVLSACHSDVATLCEGNIVGGEGLKACVKRNLNMLSDPCFRALMTVETAGMKPPPNYAASAKRMRFDDLRATQYCELNFIYADIDNATLYTEMWNSTDLNNSVDPKNFCPGDVWAKVDTTALAKAHDVIGVWKNGPRGWTMDWIDLPVGEVTTFDGWEGRWFASPTLPKGVNPNVKGSSAYKPLIVDRKSVMTFEKGKPAFILDGPDGTPWVMQAWGKIVDPTLGYDDLAKLGDKLKPAEGWKFRTVILDQDLTIKAVEGKAHLVQDELANSYDGCTPGACSFQP